MLHSETEVSIDASEPTDYTDFLNGITRERFVSA